MTVFLEVPASQYLQQYTNVQRGTIFMWLFSIFVITIVTGIRVISGQMDQGRDIYQQPQGQPPQPQPYPSASMQNFNHSILQAQTTTDDDSGSVKMVKKVDKFNTLIMPVLILFALNFTLGATYPFSLVLYFIVLVFVVLFNLMDLHKMMFQHKVFIVICENLWLIASFFWYINIWVTGKYQQPYFMYEI